MSDQVLREIKGLLSRAESALRGAQRLITEHLGRLGQVQGGKERSGEGGEDGAPNGNERGPAFVIVDDDLPEWRF